MRDSADKNTLDLVSGGARIGYARVSTTDQNLDLQRDALQRAGCIQVYEEKASGKRKADRPELAQALKALRPGDTLVVWKLDRLGRNLGDLILIVDGLAKRGVQFESITEKVDTGTPLGRMWFQVIGALAEYERGMIQERTQAGLAAARARGRNGGRKKKRTPNQEKLLVAVYEQGGVTVDEIAAQLGVSRTTVYNYLKRHQPKKAGTGEKHKGGSKK